MNPESEKIAEKSQIPFFCFLRFFVAQDLALEIDLNAAGNNRKTRHLLPRDPFPIPTLSINVRVTTKRLTHESRVHNQLVFHILIGNTIKKQH